MQLWFTKHAERACAVSRSLPAFLRRPFPSHLAPEATSLGSDFRLGMDGQHAKVVEFLRQHGGTIVAQYVEVESGNRSTRPELAMALEAARKGKSTLLIAKLDRLARNPVFIANLKDAGVDFVACDQPFASRLTLHILAAEAEDEARRISERTKAALQAAKARGVKLGSPIAVETVGGEGRTIEILSQRQRGHARRHR
jgi:DNA invertase Pin-like site-specific DNA recombinase